MGVTAHTLCAHLVRAPKEAGETGVASRTPEAHTNEKRPRKRGSFPAPHEPIKVDYLATAVEEGCG